MIGLQTPKAQAGLGLNGLRQGDGSFAGLDPAAVLAHIDFHQYIHRLIARLSLLQGLRQAAHARFAVHGNGQASALGIQGLGQLGHALQLGGCDDFVADEDVGDAAFGQRFGFADFLHAVAAGPGMLQQMRNERAFVQLGVGAPQHAMLLGKAGHALDIAVHGIQVNNQRRSVYAFDGLADQGLQMLRNVLHLDCLAEGVRYRPSLPKKGPRASTAGG